MIRGVLFDYSGTLFRFEPAPGWPSVTAATADRERLTHVLTHPTMSGDHLPPDLRDAWSRRDLDPEVHHTVYMAMLASSGVELTPEESEAVYTSLTDPTSWHAYPDTVSVLKDLRAAGIPIAVVSNIAWDIKNVFRHHDIEHLVDEYVLSYVEGVVKPDPKIFRIASQRLGLPPEETRMIGDSPEADGGATTTGADFVHVEPLPTTDRPSALRAAVSDLLPTAES